jgi:hypothetical protein
MEKKKKKVRRRRCRGEARKCVMTKRERSAPSNKRWFEDAKV